MANPYYMISHGEPLQPIIMFNSYSTMCNFPQRLHNPAHLIFGKAGEHGQRQNFAGRLQGNGKILGRVLRWAWPSACVKAPGNADRC